MDSLLPTDIQAVIEQTQKIEDELFKQEGSPPQGDAPPKTEDAPVKTEEPQAQPVADVQPEGEAPPEPEPIPPETTQVAREDLEHKFKVLQGKYNKEIKEGKNKLKEATDRLLYLEHERSDLLKRLVELTERVNKVEKGAEGQPAQTPPPVDFDSLPEAQYLQTEFPDIWKAIKTVVPHAVTGAIKGVKDKLEQVEQKVETSTKTVETTSWATFNQYLDTNVEGWREVNVDPEFKEWLEVPEPYSGLTKLELINRDIANRDGVAVAKYFKNFIQEKRAKPDRDVPPVSTTNQVAATSAQVALPKSRSGSPPQKRTTTPDIITKEHITDFYQKLQRGYFIGREAEAAAEEKRIEKAVMEGRVE